MFELTVNAGVLILWDVGISNEDGLLAFDGAGTSSLRELVMPILLSTKATSFGIRLQKMVLQNLQLLNSGS
jgi:hypothetical protein